MESCQVNEEKNVINAVLRTIASEELEEAIAKELDRDDPALQQARSILKGGAAGVASGVFPHGR